MSPLHLNLHHEIDAQRAIRQRDPLKFSAEALFIIILAFSGYYLFQLALTHFLETQLASKQAESRRLDYQPTTHPDRNHSRSCRADLAGDLERCRELAEQLQLSDRHVRQRELPE
jgi:hypothetical protein